MLKIITTPVITNIIINTVMIVIFESVNSSIFTLSTTFRSNNKPRLIANQINVYIAKN